MSTLLVPAKGKFQRLLDALRKHKNIVTIVSAFFVFATFIVKDAWDEHLRDVTAEIMSVQERNIDRSFQHATFEMSLETHFLIAEVRDKVILERDVTKDRIRLLDIWRDFTDRSWDADETLSETDSLVKMLPIGHQYGSKIAALRERKKKVNDGWAAAQPLSTEGEADRPDLDDLRNEMRQIAWDSMELEDDALKDAKGVQAWNERYHRLCVRFSYFLFACAWGLSLVSNIAGSESQSKPT